MNYFPVSHLPGAAPLGEVDKQEATPTLDKTFLEDVLDVAEVANPGSRSDALGRIDAEGVNLVGEARQSALGALPDAGKVLEDGILNREDPQAVRQHVESLLSKQDALVRNKPNLEGQLLASLEAAENVDINFVSNRSMMEKLLKKAIKDSGTEDQGILSGIVDWVDYNVAGMVGRTYEQLTDRTSRMGYTLMDIALLPPEESEAAMVDYIEGIRSEGLLNNNSEAWTQAIREFHSMGYNVSADVEFSMGVLDVATGYTAGAATQVGRRAAKKLLESKVARGATGRYNKIANIKGPKVAGEILEKAAEQGDDAALTQGGTSLLNPGSIPRTVKVTGGKVQLDNVVPNRPANDSLPTVPPSGVISPSVSSAPSPSLGTPANLGTPPSITTTVTPTVPPARAALARRNNEFMDIMEERVKKMSAGQMFSSEDIIRIQDDLKASWAARASSPVFDIKPMNLPFHELGFTVKIGDRFGNPFLDESMARKAIPTMSRDVQARVTPVPVDELDPSMGYVLQVEQRVSSNMADTAAFSLNPVSAIKRAISFLGSSSALDDINDISKGLDDNYGRAIRGEAANTALRKEVADKVRTVKKVSKDSLFTIGEVLRDLRDGVDATRKDQYSRTEFDLKFAGYHPNNRLPTEREYEAYLTIIDLEEAAWMAKASVKLDKFVAAGMESITFNGRKYIGKKVDLNNVPKTSGILDAAGNVVRKTNTTTGHTPFKSDAIYQLSDPLTNGITYIRNPEKVGILTHGDILPFNAGGRRTYKDGRYFIVSELNGTPAAKITALTQKQAETAKNQINEILEAVKRGDPNLDDVIKRNNDWDSSITDQRSFSKWMKENNVDFESRFTWKRDGGILQDKDFAPGAARIPGLTWQEKFAGSASRQDKPLVHFGGGASRVEDPLTSIGQTFASASHQLMNAVAINKGVQSWVKSLKENPSSGWNVPQDVMLTGDDFAIFRAAVPDPSGFTEQGRRLNDLRKIINQRHNISRSQGLEDSISQWLNNYAENILDSKLANVSVLGKRPVEWLGSRIVDMGNPADNLLKLGFGANFGFFSLDQTLIQASHGLMISPLIAGDTKGLRAVASFAGIRTALAARNTPTGDMAVKRLAKYIGEDEDTIKKLIEYIHTSGRSIQGSEMLEMGWAAGSVLNRTAGNSAPTAARKAWEQTKDVAGKAYDVSLSPYKSGEYLSRLSTMTSAFFSYRKQFPNGDPLSEEGLRWITRKEQAYSFHMTNSGRSWWQQGLGRFPTQWLAYPMRSMEAVFIGRDLSAAERARTTMAVFGIWGTQGVGLGYAADYLSEAMGIEPGSDIYNAIRFGVFDGLLGSVGVDVALVDRMAPFKGIIDTFSNLQEDPAYETLLGPSAGIVGGSVREFYSGFKNAWEGQMEMTKEDIFRAFRTVRTVDSISKAYSIYNYGYMNSKTGFKYDSEFSDMDAVIQAMGFAPRDVVVINNARTDKFKTDKELRETRKRYNTYMKTVLQKIGDDNPTIRQEGYELFKDIQTSVFALENLSKGEAVSIMNGLLKDNEDTINQLHANFIKQDRQFAADAFWKEVRGK